jgi:molybdopterin synthase sulfur carrier subunit
MSAPGMQIYVRYFASLREALGTGRETVTTHAPTAAALRQELAGRGGGYAEALAEGRAVRAAINQSMAADDQALADGDEVAFFPPVTGG